MKWWLAAACVVMATAGEARAEETRLTVPLEWRHVPRKGDDVKSFQRALVPKARVTFMRWQNGERAFLIQFDNGVMCTTHAEPRDVVRLACGSMSAYYDLVQHPGKQSRLEWVQDIAAAPAAEETPEPDRRKVRL